jgi:hypothetical protein
MSSLISPFFQKYLQPSEQLKVVEISAKLSINPNWLCAVIYFETAKSFSPSKTNSIGSVGLIQFTRDKAGVGYKTIGGKKYNLTDLGKMSFNQQMDIVYLYFVDIKRSTKKSLNSFLDVYLAVFFPVALNMNSDYVLQTKSLSSSLIAKQNPIFDSNKDGKIERREIENFFKGYFEKNGFNFEKDINIKPVLKWYIPVAVFFYSVFTFLM